MRPSFISEEQFKVFEQRVRGGVDEHVGKAVEARATQGRASGRMPVPNPAPSPFRSKLEQAYSGYLHVLMLAGDIKFYRYEPIRMVLAKDCTLTVDFMVMCNDGSLEWHEVKGRKREDAMIKLKVAARIFPWWKFILVERRRGIWELKEMAAA